MSHFDNDPANDREFEEAFLSAKRSNERLGDVEIAAKLEALGLDTDEIDSQFNRLLGTTPASASWPGYVPQHVFVSKLD